MTRIVSSSLDLADWHKKKRFSRMFEPIAKCVAEQTKSHPNIDPMVNVALVMAITRTSNDETNYFDNPSPS